MIYAGSQRIPILGFGNVMLRVTSSKHSRPQFIRLKDVALCKDFVCNVVSLRQLVRSGLWWDMRPGNCCLRTRTGSLVCELLDRADQFILEDVPTIRAVLVSQGGRSHRQKTSKATAQYWHLRLGRPGPEALNRLVNATTGAKILGPTTVQYDDCGTTKTTCQYRESRDGMTRAPAYEFPLTSLILLKTAKASIA